MRLGFCAVGSLLFVVTGCSMNRLAVPVRDAGVAIRGSVRGGQQPINGMRVYLLAANTTGYGNASVSLLTSGTAGSDSVGGYVLSGSDGSFSITGDYTCTTGTQVYLYGLGGNPGAGVNPSAGLMAALGNCPAAGNFAGATPFIAMNEVSTVASAYAMAGFATDATHVSSSGTTQAQVGIKNAFANGANLETLSTGAALATTSAGNGTVPQAEINSLADVLAACLNTDGTVSGPTTPTPCYTLFTNALSGGTTGTQPGDTATAAINIAHHPIANVAGLYGLVSASAPFQPTLTAAPNDWTVAVLYTTVQLDSRGNGALQNSLAIDGQGNVWIANQHTTSVNLAASVSELSSNGTILSGAAGFTGGGIGGSSDDPGNIAIDPSGNVWVSNGYYFDGSLTPSFVGLGLTEFSSSGTPISGAGGYTAGCGGQGLAIDGSGNVWTSAGKCDSSGNYLFAVPSPPPLVASYPNEASSISIDTSGNAWYSGTTKITTRTSTQTEGGVWKVSNSGVPLFNTPSFVAGSGFGGASYIANDTAGNAWFIGGPTNSPLGIYELGGSGSVLFTASPATATFYLQASVAMDGAGDVWAGNDDFNLNASTGLVEVSNSGTTLSGATGFVSPQPPPKTFSPTYAVSGVGVDGSGNVWIALYSGTVVQFVGAAAPVVTPLSVGVKNGTLGTLP